MSRASGIGLVQFFFLAFAILFFPTGSAFQVTLILISMLLFGWTWFELDRSRLDSGDGVWLPWIAFMVIGIFSLNRFTSLPFASSEYIRYFWDAIVSAHGYNPFLNTPQAVLTSIPGMTGISEQTGINSGISLHPPVAQWLFTFALHYPLMTISTEWFVYRLEILFTTIYVVSAWILLILNRNETNSSSWTVAFLLCPVFLFQGILEVHSGFIAVPWVILTALLLKKNLHFLSGAVLAAAVGSDLMAVTLIPFLFFLRMEIKTAGLIISGFLLASFLIWMPFLFSPGLPGYQSILREIRLNEFNSLFPALWVTVSGLFDVQFSDILIRAIFFSLFLTGWGFLIYFSVRQSDWKVRLRFGLFGLLAFLLFSPEVQPWMMILPFTLSFVLQIVPFSLGAWFTFSMFTILINNQPYAPDSYWQFRIWEYSVVIPLLIADGYRFLGPFIRSGNQDTGIVLSNQQNESDFLRKHS